ncbi:MAG TPA: hypothetical protein VFT53_02185 [Candidatus Saccharimonadales bacterium]|nr:hypothetical protein [Candidatus Saccharimonadales bacterium]
MISTETWSNLMAENPTPVDPTHELRPLADDVVQYVRGGREYIAVRDTNGYGEASDDTPHTLQRVVEGGDFSTYEVPPYLASVAAVTREFGAAGIEDLKPIYRAIGQLLYEAAQQPIRPPVVRVDDVAIDMRTNELYYVPPVIFTQAEVTTAAYELWMKKSIAHTFKSLFERSVVTSLQSEITQGMKQ